jgi:hypothetical protein
MRAQALPQEWRPGSCAERAAADGRQWPPSKPPCSSSKDGAVSTALHPTRGGSPTMNCPGNQVSLVGACQQRKKACFSNYHHWAQVEV